ncbi:MAG: hypothetical protein HDR14_11100 [Lachnospiraceae bacterium]|nr:hypothetical protein [Lachnospiraceae bacterium]
MITYTMVPDEEIYKVLAELYYEKSATYKNRKRKLITISMMGLILVAMSLWGTALSGEGDYYWVAFLILGVFSIAYGFYMVFFGAKKQVMNTIRQKNQAKDASALTYTLGDDIQVHSEKTDARIDWDLIEEKGEISHFIYLRCSGATILLDKNKLSTEELSELSELLKRVG